MPVLLPVERVKQVCNPFQKAVWDQGPRLTRRAVAEALLNRRLASEPTSADHAARVAFFVENESTDPIDIDVGVPALGCHVMWPVQDGNHPLAAAIYSGRIHILGTVGGQLSYAESLFGVDCTEPQEPEPEPGCTEEQGAGLVKRGLVYIFKKSGNEVRALCRVEDVGGLPCWRVERIKGASAGKRMVVPARSLAPVPGSSHGM